MTGPRILIVEDEFLIRLTLVEALNEEGFTVHEAATGEEAMSWLQRGESLDVLLTDIQLTGTITGREVAEAARRQTPDLPVIYTSGASPAPATDRPARDLFIAKPYHPYDIAAAARRAIAGE